MNESVSLPTKAAEKWTSIRLKVSTLDLFKKYGAKGDSYDDVLLRVIKALEDPGLGKTVRVKIRKALYPTF